jgi:hypothetical protein
MSMMAERKRKNYSITCRAKWFTERWVGPEGNLLFITVDGPWDLHLVDGPMGKMPPAK